MAKTRHSRHAFDENHGFRDFRVSMIIYCSYRSLPTTKNAHSFNHYLLDATAIRYVIKIIIWAMADTQ